MAEDSLRCRRCHGVLVYAGRISLPAQIIYKCQSCGYENWLKNEAPPSRAPLRPEQSAPQQQEQPQPNKPESEAD